MQGGGPGDIRHRISMEGGDEVKKQLADLGQAGENAFEQIRRASEASGSRLASVSSAVSSIRSTFATVATSIAPVAQQFGEVQKSVVAFGSALSNVGDRVFPHFREAVALGTAAGIAGLLEFAVSGARAAKDIGDLSAALGISVERFQGYKGAAAAAGIEGDKFASMLARFSQKATEAANAQLQDFGTLAKLLIGDISTLGADVLRGTQKTAQGAASVVLRGGQGVVNALSRNLYSIDARVSDSVSKGTQLGKMLGDQGNILAALLRQAGVETHKSGAQLAQDLANIASHGDAAGRSARDLLAKLGGANLVPATSAFEAIDRYTQSWQANLARVVTMWKVVDNQVVPKTMEEAFAGVADQVHNMGNSMQATAFVRANFGRDATRLVEVLRKGSEGVEELITDFTKLGIAITPAETEIGSKLVTQFEHLETAIMNIRTALAVGIGEAFGPIIEAFTQAIGANMTLIRQWAQTIATQIAPGLKELAHWIEGTTTAAQIQTQWVRTLIDQWNAAKEVVKLVVDAFSAITTAMDYVAKAVNFLFGTQFTGGALLAILAIGKITGAFGLLSAATNLALDAFMLFVTKPLVALIEIASKLGLIRAAVVALQLAFSSVVSFFSGGSVVALFAPLLAAIGPVGWVILGIAAIAAALITWEGAWGDVFKFLKEGWDNLFGTVKAFIDLVKSAAQATARLFSSGGSGDLSGSSSATIGGSFASGGRITGPAGIDTVPIRATAGEFVMRTAAVAHYGLDAMYAINAMRLPALGHAPPGPVASIPPPSLRFAMGGAVPALSGADRAAVHLHLGGDSFGLETDGATADRLVRVASTERVLSSGRKPSWYGGG